MKTTTTRTNIPPSHPPQNGDAPLPTKGEEASLPKTRCASKWLVYKQVLRACFDTQKAVHCIEIPSPVPRKSEVITWILRASKAHGSERGGTRLLVVNRSVPLCKKTWLGPCRILGLASSTNGIFCTYIMPEHLDWCSHPSIFGGVQASTSNRILFVPVRLGRSVPPKKKKGCNTSSSSSY